MTAMLSWAAAGFAGRWRLPRPDMADEILLALSTFPDAETARRIAEELVTEHLVACANILPARAVDLPLAGEIGENLRRRWSSLRRPRVASLTFQAKLKSLHPYDVPEIVAVRVSAGLPEYLRWVSENCS